VCEEAGLFCSIARALALNVLVAAGQLLLAERNTVLLLDVFEQERESGPERRGYTCFRLLVHKLLDEVAFDGATP